jgi:uncharacterized protein (TIGR03437 family)
MMHFSKRLLPEILFLSLLTAGGASAQFISIVSGDGQVVTQNNVPQNPMVVVVRNAQGQPVPGTPVTWTLNGQGSIIGGFTTTTDSNGMSSNTFLGATLFNLSFTQTIIIASAAGSSVSFTETTSGLDTTSTASLVQAAVTYPGLGTVLSGASGSVGSTPVQVQVFSTGISGGQGLANVLIRLIPANTSSGPQVACSGNTGYTNAMGNTNCLPVFSGAPGTGQYSIDVGGGYRVFGPYSFTVMQGSVSAFRIMSGNNQSGAPGATIPNPLTAQTQDAAGNPLPNVPVTWTVLTPNTATITTSSSSSDANGNVSATVRLGSIVGPVQIQLSSPQGGTPVVFTLQVNLQITGVNKIAGDNQDAIINTIYAQPLVVQVNSSQGPGAGVQVQFTSTGAIPVLFPNGSSATTGSNGQASVAVQAGPSSGTAIVTASIGGFSAAFTLTIRPPGPAITTSSFFSAAGGQASGGVTPTSLTAIYGAGIATGLQGCVTGPQTYGAQPLLVSGVTVLFTEGGFSAYGPILSVCNLGVGQEYVVVEVPAELPLGATSVTVRAGIGSKTVDGVLVTPATPGVFETVMSDGQKRAVLQHAADGSFVSLENKAQRGEKLRAYVTGLGRPITASGVPIGTNQSGIAGDDAAPQVPVIAGVADEGVTVDSAVYSTDLIGVYIVTFTVPSDVPSGNNLDFAIAVNLNGNFTFSNASKIPVQ